MDQEAWVHWDYSPEEWALFDRIDWGLKLRRRVAKWLLIGLPIALALPIFFSLLGAPLPFAVAFFALGLLFVFGFGLLSYFFGGEDRARHQARRKRDQPQRVTLSRDGVWVAGTHFPLGRLEDVTMTSEPAVLHFRRLLPVRAPQGTGWVPSPLHLLLPRGHEEEAARLMQRYHREVIEPKKREWERLMAPPEPR